MRLAATTHKLYGHGQRFRASLRPLAEKHAHKKSLTGHRGVVMNRACRSWHPVHAGAAGSGPRSAPPSLHPSPLGPRPPSTRGDPAQHPEHPKHKHLMDFSETVRGKEIGEQQRTSNCAREAAHPLARARTQVGRFERPRHRRIPLALETFRILRVPELARSLARAGVASEWSAGIACGSALALCSP